MRVLLLLTCHFPYISLQGFSHIIHSNVKNDRWKLLEYAIFTCLFVCNWYNPIILICRNGIIPSRVAKWRVSELKIPHESWKLFPIFLARFFNIIQTNVKNDGWKFLEHATLTCLFVYIWFCALECQDPLQTRKLYQSQWPGYCCNSGS